MEKKTTDEKLDYVWVPRGYSSKVRIKDDDIQMVTLESVSIWASDIQEKYKKAISALMEIRLGRGPFSTDHAEHAWNTITSMKTTAREALVKMGEWPPETCPKGPEHLPLAGFVPDMMLCDYDTSGEYCVTGCKVTDDAS